MWIGRGIAFFACLLTLQGQALGQEQLRLPVTTSALATTRGDSVGFQRGPVDLLRANAAIAAQAQKDSLKNGILLGFAAGVSVAALMTAVNCREGSDPDQCYATGAIVWAPLFGAAGAITGGIVDARHAAFPIPGTAKRPVYVSVGNRSVGVSMTVRR
jgi:hypothetical protein